MISQSPNKRKFTLLKLVLLTAAMTFLSSFSSVDGTWKFVLVNNASAACTPSGNSLNCSGTSGPISSTIGSDVGITNVDIAGSTSISNTNLSALGGAIEIRAEQANSADLNFNIANGATLNSTNSKGLSIINNSGSNSNTTVNNNGLNSTIGSISGGGIVLFANGSNSGDVIINSNAGVINATGSSSPNVQDSVASGIEIARRGDAGGSYNAAVNFTGGEINLSGRGSAIFGSIFLSNTSDSTATGDLDFNMSGGTIKTEGDFSSGIAGLYATNAEIADGNINVFKSGGSIETSGTGSRGIRLEYFSAPNSNRVDLNANISDGLISATGNGASGIYVDAQNGDSNIDVSGGQITTFGLNSSGISSDIRGNGDTNINISGGSITTDGDRSIGINVQSNTNEQTGDININMSGGEISTSGLGTRGILVQSQFPLQGGANNVDGDINVNVTGGSISTSGDAGGAILIQNAMGTSSGNINISHNGNIKGVGRNSDLIRGTHTGSGDINISTSGTLEGSRGLSGNINSGTLNILIKSGASIITSNESGAVGVGTSNFAFGGGQKLLTIESGATLDSSASGLAIRDFGDGAITVNTAGNVIGDALLGEGDDVFNLTGGSFDGSIFGELGDDTFQWTGGDLTGGISGGDGSDTFLIASGANYDGSQLLDGGDDVSSADGFTDVLTIQGQNTTTSSSNIINFERVVIDGGSIAFSDNQFVTGSDIDSNGLFLINSAQLLAGDAFALTGNLGLESGARGVFEGGGLGVYSVSGNLTNNGIVDLEDGATGDVLTVAGNYSGSGELLVDVDFANDESDRLVIEGDVDPNAATVVTVNDVTTGDATGNLIPIIDVAGNRQASNFVLANGPIISGAFFYDFALDDRGFALASTLIPVTPPPPGGGGNSGGGNETRTPLLQASFLPQIATFEVLAQQFLDLNKLPKYIERGSGTYANKGVESAGGWAAVSYGRNSTESSFSTTRSEHSNRGVTVQLGGDVMAFNVGQSAVSLGGYLELKRGSGNVASEFGGGEFDDLDSDGFVLTATSLSDNGLYVDGQLSYKDIDAEVTPNFLLQRDANGVTRVVNNSRDREFVLDGELDGEGYGASIEVGQVLKANDHFNIIPQAQLSYSEVDFDSFTGPNGERVSLADASSTVARLGVAIESSQSTELEKGFKSFASLDLLYDFEADTRVNIGGFGLINEDESLFVDLGLGGSYAFGDKGQYGLSTKFNVSSSVQNFFDSYGLEGLVQFNAKF